MQYSEQLLKQQQALVEELGVYFELSEAMPPLSARIFAYLVLIGDQGASFDEITERLNASKSSVSTNLQLLQNAGSVTYFTKSGDRKRYFKIDADQIKNRIDAKIDTWKKEKILHEKVSNYKVALLKHNHIYDENNSNLQFGKHYISVIESIIENLTNLKENLNSIQIKNNEI